MAAFLLFLLAYPISAVLPLGLSSTLVHDADHISQSTASSDLTHKPCDPCVMKQSTALNCAEQHCWVTLVAGVAGSDIILIQHHHHLLMKRAAQPSSSIIASSGDTIDKPCD